MRVACYARFSSDLQRATSIDDQVATARRYAAAHGWTFLEAQVYTDAAISGASLERPGIQALLRAAQDQPRPFDVLLVDDSSRVSRDLSDAVRLLQDLKFAGARVIYISQNIDSANEQAETLVAVHGVVDSLYLREMAKKIKRGLAGQLERGFATGSVTYGYRTVPIQDPSGKTDVNGYPVLLGKRVEIIREEARVIVQIFELYAAGLGTLRIIERLQETQCRAPRGGSWKPGAVKRVLDNEKYTGKLIWGKKRFERRPGTRQEVARRLPRHEWHVLERPELRIVSDELWARVQARRQLVREAVPAQAGGGLRRGGNAALFSRHLFSGFLTCATCGGAMVTVTGGHGSPRYGCLRSHRNGRQACTNRLTIRAKVADAHLLAGLQAQIDAPETLRAITTSFTEALNRLHSERPRQLLEARAAAKTARQRLKRLVDAIEQGVPAPTLTDAIAAREGELRRWEATLADLSRPLPRRLEVLPTMIKRKLADLGGFLREKPERVKLEFQRTGLRVTMTPVADEDGKTRYRATVVNSLLALNGIMDLRGAEYSAAGRSHPTDDASRPPRFTVDLPPNHLGPGWRKAV